VIAKLRKSVVVPMLALAAWLARAASAPIVSLEITPPNPTAGQIVRLREASAGAGADWLWDFGDGISAQTASPAHAWTEPGTYTVRLLTAGSSAEAPIVVSPAGTLRLNAAHPFEATVEAYARGSGEPSAGQAFAQSDRFGWFSFPGITGDPENPEVTIKVLEAPQAGHYWIFWGGMTSLDYTLTVREVATGHVEIYRKEGPEACGGFDTQSFAFVPTETPSASTATPTQASTAGPSVTGTPTTISTRTPTRTPTATPSITPTPTTTPSPTPAPPPFVALRAIQWQWDFFSTDLGVNGGSDITLHVGQTYQILVYNDDLPDVTDEHYFSGVSGIGLTGGPLPQGGALPIQTITPQTAGDYGYLCTNYCGVGHDSMLGTIHVVP
jgi:PKD repeat protein